MGKMTGDLVTVCGPVGSVHTDATCKRWCAARPSGPTGDVPVTAAGATTVSREQITLLRSLPSSPPSARIAPPRTRYPRPNPAELEAATLLDTAKEGVRALLRLMGEDPERPGIVDTPSRVVKAYLELADRPGDPATLLSKVFADVDTSQSEMIAVPGIEFVSICEHHLLPFTGTATVAYLPSAGGVVGLSKIPRLVQHYAMRPQVQERLTEQIVEALEKHLAPLGSACLIESSHACMALRGVRASSATMVTSALRGRFLENPATRSEFMAIARAR
jgi:GTP cyclohydrolase I